MIIVVFLVIALVVVTLFHYYLWRKLVRATTRPGLARRLGTIAIVAGSALLVGNLVASRTLPHSVQTVLAWPGYLWLAVLFYLFLTLLVLELPAWALRRRLARRPTEARGPEARGPEARGPEARGPEARGPEARGPEARGPVTEPVPVAAGVAAPAGAGTDLEPAPPISGVEDRTDEPTPTLGDHRDRPASGEPARPTDNGETRRLFLARGVAITAGLVAAGVTASGVHTALAPPRIKRIQVPLAKLPQSADGTRIALVSDIHLGPLRGYSHTRRIVDMINGLDADVVAVVGDLVDGTVAELGHAATPLRDLRSKNGAYFVTGNHEYFSGYKEWVEEVAELGVKPLRNERVALPQGLDLAGVNDATGASQGDAPDYDAALRDRDPGKAVILLAHQPVQAHEAAKRGVDLQLSGHTHGGQIWPFTYVVRATGQPVVSGMGDVDGMPVYVTNGAGFWGPPVRVGAPPDITLVELRSVR